jgi:hypothetical protein
MLTAATFISLAALAQVAGDDEPENLLGWTLEPPAPVEGQETELDRLSRSPSGSGFDAQIYGSAGDDDRVPVSVTLRALDKITAQFRDLEVPIGQPQTFGTLTLLPRTCSTRPPEEFPETTVFLEVFAGEADVAGQRARDAEMEARGDMLDPVQVEGEGGLAAPAALGPSVDEEIFGSAIFRGWMFASSPSLNGMQHPTYDVWVIDCKMEDPAI